MECTIDELLNIKNSLLERFREVKELAEKELLIDDFALDSEAIRTPRIHSRWVALLGEESFNLNSLLSTKAKLKLERFRYYNGTQTDEYYKKYGIVNQRILKTDMNLYMDADRFISVLNEIIGIQEMIVDFIERSIKEITARTFHIKSAIEWRKFQSGA